MILPWDVSLSACLSVCLSVCLSASLSAVIATYSSSSCFSRNWCISWQGESRSAPRNGGGGGGGGGGGSVVMVVPGGFIGRVGQDGNCSVSACVPCITGPAAAASVVHVSHPPTVN